MPCGNVSITAARCLDVSAAWRRICSTAGRTACIADSGRVICTAAVVMHRAQTTNLTSIAPACAGAAA